MVFALTISVIQASTAAVKASWTKRGAYSRDWLSAIQSLAGNVRSELQIQEPAPRARSEFEMLTWLPEAALPFFKGLEYYGAVTLPPRLHGFGIAMREINTLSWRAVGKRELTRS